MEERRKREREREREEKEREKERQRGRFLLGISRVYCIPNILCLLAVLGVEYPNTYPQWGAVVNVERSCCHGYLTVVPNACILVVLDMKANQGKHLQTYLPMTVTHSVHVADRGHAYMVHVASLVQCTTMYIHVCPHMYIYVCPVCIGTTVFSPEFPQGAVGGCVLGRVNNHIKAQKLHPLKD